MQSRTCARFRTIYVLFTSLLATASTTEADPRNARTPSPTQSERDVVIQMHRIGTSAKRLDIELLRSKQWVNSQGLHVGGFYSFTGSEPNLSGLMIIDALRNVDRGRDGLNGQGRAGRVTGRFVTQGAKVYRLSLFGGHEIEATGSHPIYSLDRDSWVRVSDLEPGERLRTRDHEVVVESVVPRKGSVLSASVREEESLGS